MPPEMSIFQPAAHLPAEVFEAVAESPTSGGAVPPPDHLLEVVRRIRDALGLERLAVLARVYETDDVLVRLPIAARASISVALLDQIEGQRIEIGTSAHVIGLLATDHVGYASFDLRGLRNAAVLYDLAVQVPDDVDPDTIEVDLALQLLPFGDDLLAIDPFAVGDVSPRSVVVRFSIEQAWLEGRAPDLALPAMQNPGIADWRTSPGSFALASERVLGEGGCEDLYPSDLSTHHFRLLRTLRMIDKSRPVGGRSAVRRIRYGLQLEFGVRWFPIGHSLGQVLYSLPLAAGETVRLAIIDWKRTDSAGRDETTQLVDTLEHDTQRDRVITEVVNGVVEEWQEGSSITGGLSLSALAPVGPALVGGTLGIGAASTDSHGTRNLSVDMAQRLSDTFHQSSAAVRQLRSTVVTQASQAETSRTETRSITNHNHCHTLTILYYEVLRHHRITTTLDRVTPVVLVEFDLTNGPDLSSERDVMTHRGPLEQALLDPRHLAGFRALARVRAARHALADARDRHAAGGAPDLSTLTFGSFYLLLRTGSNGADAEITVDLVHGDGRRLRCRQVDPPQASNSGPGLDTAGVNEFSSNSMSAFVARTDEPVQWGDISGFIVTHTDDDDGAWDLAHLRVVGFAGDDRSGLLFDNPVGVTLSNNETQVLPAREPGIDPATVPPQLTDHVDAAELAAANALLEHLEEHRDHYRLAALVGADPVRRARTFDGVDLGDGTSLLDVIENRVVGRAGREIAFPLTGAGDRIVSGLLDVDPADRPATSVITSEDLVSLPTRGVFADGKLGRCSTCERIDDDRVWDFASSPLPDHTPDITPVGTDSRFQQPLQATPTALPGSLLNIVNPPAVPDPAFAGALQILGSSGLFRDMSGSQALGSFLTAMTNANAQAVSGFAKGEQLSRLIDKIDGLEGLSPEQKSELVKQALGGGDGGKSGDAQGDGGDGGGGRGGTQLAGSADGGGTDDATGDGDGAGGATETSPVERRAAATRRRSSRKPTRPVPAPPADQMHVQVALSLQGILDPGDITASMVIDLVGEAGLVRVGPVAPVHSALQATIPRHDPPGGILTVRVDWEVRHEVSQAERTRNQVLQFFGGDNRKRRPSATGLVVFIHDQEPFEFPAGASLLSFVVTPIIAEKRVTATSASSAAVKVSAGVSTTFVPIVVSASVDTTLSSSDSLEIEYVVQGMQGLDIKAVPHGDA